MKSSFIRNWMDFDLFGIMPSISFNGKSKSVTSVGNIFSIFLIFYMLWAIYQSFQDLVFKQNPNTIISTTLGRHTGVDFGQNHLNIGFSLINTYTGEYSDDLSIMQPVFLKFTLPEADEEGKIVEDPQFTILEACTCTPEHFNNQFSILGYCLSLDQNVTIGVISREVILVQFRQCNNATSPIPCQDQEVIDQAFDTYQLMATYPAYYFEPNDFDNPISVERGNYAVRASSTLSKQLRISLTEYELQTDTGFILPLTSSESRLEISSLSTDVTNDGKKELTAIIHMSGNKVTQHRSYMKLQQALAGSVALIRVGILAFGIFLLPFTKIVYFQNLINNSFSTKKPTIEVKQKKFFKIMDPKLSCAPEASPFKIIQRRRSSVFSNKNQQSGNASSSVVPLNFEDSLNQSLSKIKSKPSPFKASAEGSRRGSLFQKENNNSFMQFYQSSFQGNKEMNGSGDLETGNGSPTAEVNKNGEEEHSNGSSSEVEKKKNSEKDDQIIQIHKIPQDLVPLRNSESDEQSEVESVAKARKQSAQFKIIDQLNLDPTPKENPVKPTSNDLVEEKNIIHETPVKIWLRKFFGCYRSSGAQRYNVGRRKIFDTLSVDRLLENIRDVDRLKMLIFDETQRVIFDNLPKPDLMGPDERENALEKAARLNKDINFDNELNQLYNILATKQGKSMIDKKLIKWFENGYFEAE